jgi:hypothetical protein
MNHLLCEEGFVRDDGIEVLHDDHIVIIHADE